MKRTIALLLSILIALSVSPVAFADEVTNTNFVEQVATTNTNILVPNLDKVPAFDYSKEILLTSIDYLNKVYIEQQSSIAFYINGISIADKDILTNLVNSIVDENDSDTVKAQKIYNYVNSTVAYGNPRYPSNAMGVLYDDAVLCTGFANLTAALFKCANIPAAICRGQKLHTRPEEDNLFYCDISQVFACKYGHQWCMAYVDGQWTLYDAVWDNVSSDVDFIATWYFLEQIDGVTPYTNNDLTKKIWSAGLSLYYIDDQFKVLAADIADISPNAKFNFGSGLYYIVRARADNSLVYYEGITNPQGIQNVELYEAWQEGLYRTKITVKNNHNDYYYVLSNGTQVPTGIIEADDRFFVFNRGSGIEIPENLAYHSQIFSEIVVYPGETFDGVKLFYEEDLNDPSNTFVYASSASKYLTVDENGVITAIAPGSVYVTCQRNGGVTKTISFKISNFDSHPFEQYCSHIHTYDYNDSTICCYCGKTLSTITETSTDIEEVIETATDIVTETDIVVTFTNVITSTDVSFETPTNVETTTDIQEEVISETDLEEVTTTDLTTETDVEEVTTTDVISETDSEEVTVTDIITETDLISETNIIETQTDFVEETINAPVITETDTEEITSTDIVTNSDIVEIVDYSELVRQELAKHGIEISKEDWEKDSDDEEEIVTETNMTSAPSEVVIQGTLKVSQTTETDIITETNIITETTIETPVITPAPVVVRSSGGSGGGSGSGKKVIDAPIVKTEEIKIVEEVKTEEKVEEVIIETPTIEEVKTENTPNVSTVIRSSEKEIVKAEIDTNEIAESAGQMLETISVALTNMVKSLNTLFVKLFK